MCGAHFQGTDHPHQPPTYGVLHRGCLDYGGSETRAVGNQEAERGTKPPDSSESHPISKEAVDRGICKTKALPYKL